MRKNIIIYSSIWMVLSDFNLSLDNISFGILSIITTLFVSKKISTLQGEVNKKQTLRYYTTLIKYFFGLIKEIILSALNITKKVWESDEIIHEKDVFVEVQLRQGTESRQVLLANSITLTPGTISVDINAKKNTVLVNTFNTELKKDVESNTFHQSINLIERAKTSNDDQK